MRVVLYTSHHVYNAYTLETSLAGADGRYDNRHYTYITHMHIYTTSA
jgi:hypothetical protein